MPLNLRSVTALVLLGLAASCSSIRTFQAQAEPAGGYDGAGDGDQLYFVLRNLEGFTDDGFALVLPADWSSRERVPRGEHVGLAEPVERRWMAVEQAQPATQLQRHSGPWNSPYGVPSEASLLVVRDLQGPRLDDAVVTHLEQGQGVYAVVRRDRGLFRSYDVYGASGPPLEWVWLMDLDFRDRRGLGAQLADVALRQTGVVIEATYLTAVITSPVWIWFVL